MHHSPNLALVILVDRISKALENEDFVLRLFLDFSKAFDTVNHSILFEKWSSMVFEGYHYNGFKVISLIEHSMLNITTFT